MKVTYTGEGQLMLHQEIGRGNLPDGRECRLIQTNYGIHMQVYPKGKKNFWKTFTVSYFDLSAAMVEEIVKIEANIQEKLNEEKVKS
jgi:hypothetical protein